MSLILFVKRCLIKTSEHKSGSSSEIYHGKLVSVSKSEAIRDSQRHTNPFTPNASLWPFASQLKQCWSSVSGSPFKPFILGLSPPGGRLRFHAARGKAYSPTLKIKIRSLVAPAKKAPSGVKDRPTTGLSSMVR